MLKNLKLDESNIIAAHEKTSAGIFVNELPGMLNCVVKQRSGGIVDCTSACEST